MKLIFRQNHLFGFTTLLPFIFCSVRSYSADSKCEDALLSSFQIEALSKAATGDYKIKAMSGKVDGILRTVVFLGESHLKGDVDDLLGKDVVDEFGVVGYEGASGFNTALTTRVFGKIVKTVYSIAVAAGAKPSTIKYALDVPKSESSRINIHLEEGHTVNTREKIGVVVLSANAAVAATLGLGALTAVCAGPVLGTLSGHPGVGLGIGFIMFKVVAIGGWILHAISEITGYGDWHESYRNNIFCNTRDPVMSENILKAFRQDSELQKMLVIVGSEHVWGISSNLSAQGFQAIDIEPNSSNRLRNWNLADWNFDRQYNGRKILKQLASIGRKEAFLKDVKNGKYDAVREHLRAINMPEVDSQKILYNL